MIKNWAQQQATRKVGFRCFPTCIKQSGRVDRKLVPDFHRDDASRSLQKDYWETPPSVNLRKIMRSTYYIDTDTSIASKSPRSVFPSLKVKLHSILTDASLSKSIVLLTIIKRLKGR